MPFTAPLLLAVAGSQFDCLIEHTGTYTKGGTGGSNQYSYNGNGGTGTFSVISDPKGITSTVYDAGGGNYDSIVLNKSGTLKMTVVSNYTYSSTNSSDQAGINIENISSDGGTTVSPSMDHTTFSSGSPVAVEDVTLNLAPSRPGLVFQIKRAGSGETFTASGRLLIGINKT